MNARVVLSMFARKGPRGLPDAVEATCKATWIDPDGTEGDDLSDAQTLAILEQAKMSILQGVPFVQPEPASKIEVVPASIVKRLNGSGH